MGRKRILATLVTIGMYLFLIASFVVLIHEKKNLHTDEVLTYILANNTVNDSIQLAPELGKKYTPADTIWKQMMTVQEGHQFDYGNVWSKQAADVHPPLYYVLIHTICSFFPGQYSKWFAAAVNLVFLLLTLYALRKLTWELTGNAWVVFVCSAFFCISSGVLSSTTFLRMYVMVMFLVTWLTYLFVRGVSNRDWRFYVCVTLTALAGALTHYYFVVYLIFICVVFGIVLLWQRAYKDLGKLIFCMLAAGGLTIAVFPASIRQSIGGGYRGVDTIHNLMDTSVQGMAYRLRECFSLLNQQLFGKCFWILLAGLLLIGLTNLGKAIRLHTGMPQISAKWFVVAVPVILYFLVISKIAVYLIDRYFHPIYAVATVLVIGALTALAARLPHQKIVCGSLCLGLVIVSLIPWRQNWNYLYRHSGHFLEQTANYVDRDALFVVEYAYEMGTAFYEAGNYRSMTFLTTRDLDRLEQLELSAENGLILILGNGCDTEMVVERIGSTWESLQSVQELGGYSSTKTLYLD